MTLYFFSVYLHVVAACAWIGSMLFFAAVVVPALRNRDMTAHAALVTRIVGKHYGTFGWVSLAVLVATGCTNLWARGICWAQLTTREFWQSGFGLALGHKLVFVAAVIVATAAHYLVQGSRKRASWLGRVTLLLSLVVVYYALALVRG
jgi:uncharacterized membrane protein